MVAPLQVSIRASERSENGKREYGKTREARIRGNGERGDSSEDICDRRPVSRASQGRKADDNDSRKNEKKRREDSPSNRRINNSLPTMTNQLIITSLQTPPTLSLVIRFRTRM
jgi:hypothetical protein